MSEKEYAIKQMCKKLKCILNPENCLRAEDKYLYEYDCDGPYTEQFHRRSLEERS
jgi:hypothetical protein